MKLSDRDPRWLQRYRDALVEGHNMSDLEFEHRLAEIEVAMKESIERFNEDVFRMENLSG
ncbi:MAG: hypothetical protein KAV87_50380 [Desulfobacteraceae bacterium]|nr:hypothetical protein [Desulfobacteraceae bacterium]